MTETQWVVIGTLLVSTAICYTVWRVAIVWRRFREEPLPREVRERSHSVANQAMAVQASLNELKRDAARKRRHPFDELVDRIRTAEWEREHK